MTLEKLCAIFPRLSPISAAVYKEPLCEAMLEFGINTPTRAAAFLAQLAHESSQLRHWEEIWGPTEQQLKYERPEIDGIAAHMVSGPMMPLWQKLGNFHPGDGYRYRGRGPIQITGRENYRKCGEALGLELEQNPEKLTDPSYGFRAAGWFWRSRNLSQLADTGDFHRVTKKINGGLNGLEDRLAHWSRVKTVLGLEAHP